MKPKIHWYTLHYKGVSAGDHFTDVPGLVTCSYCKRLLAKKNDERLKKIGKMMAQVAYYQNAAEHSVEPTVESVGTSPAVSNQSESDLPA